MKNLERSYLRIPLLLNKIDVMIGKLEKHYKLTPIKDELLVEFESELGKLLSSVYTPQYDGDSPKYLTTCTLEFWNKTFDTILSDLTVLFSEFENTENYNVEKFNTLTLRAHTLIAYTKRLYGLLVRSEKYFYDAKSRYHWITEEFVDDSLVELGSQFLTKPQCELNTVEGIITTTREVEQGGSGVEVRSITINPPSNGVPGNSVLPFKEKRDNPMNMVDGNPSTWFEYELVKNVGDDDEVLYLDITARLTDIKVVNNIVLEFVNSSSQDLVVIDRIRTSLDGSSWDDIDYNSTAITVGASKNTTGIVSFTTDPRQSMYLNIKMRQGIPKKQRTQYGVQNRYFIGIKTMTVNSIMFTAESEIITTQFDFPRGYNYVSLLTTEYPGDYSSAYRYEYYISPNEANNWYQVLPSNCDYSLGGVPRLLEFNTESKDSISLGSTPTSLILKIKLVRDDSMFTAGYVASDNDKIVESEFVNAGELEGFYQLQNHALKGTVLVERTSLGSVGAEGTYIVGTGSSAPNQEFKIPIDLRSASTTLYVSGHEWKRVSSLANSSPTDQHYTVNIYNNRVKFGDGVHGALPEGKIEISITEDIIGFSPDRPHTGELTFYCDGNKDSVKLYTTKPYAFINQHRLGRGLKHMKTGFKQIYNYERVTELVPRGTNTFTLNQPAFVTYDLLLEDKEVFSIEVDTVEEVVAAGQYHVGYDEFTRLITVTSHTYTNHKNPGYAYYNAVGKLSPRKISQSQPYDKQPYYTTKTDGTGLPTNTIRVAYHAAFASNAIVRLWSAAGDTQFNKIVSSRKEGTWSIVSLSETMSADFVNGDTTGYSVQVLQRKNMAPSFSNPEVFQREQPYQDGSNELMRHGDYSINYSQGDIFSFTETSTTVDDTVSFYFAGEQEIPHTNWDFLDDKRKPLFKKIVIDDSTYREAPEAVGYVVSPDNYSYIKPGKGCSDTEYTRIRYTDDFLKDPSNPKFMVCGTTAEMIDNGDDIRNRFPLDGPRSNIDWHGITVSSTPPTVTATLSLNRTHFIKGQTILANVSIANNLSEYQNVDMYVDLELPGERFVSLYRVPQMNLPPDFYVNNIRVAEYPLHKNYQTGTYNVWFGIFEAGTDTLISSLCVSSFEFKRAHSHGEGEFAMDDFTSTNTFKATFVPYYDLLRGKFLPEGVKVANLGYQNIIDASLKFICVDSSKVCVHSFDAEALAEGDTSSIHMCRKGFRARSKNVGDLEHKDTPGRHYYDYCENVDCPLYLTHRKHREAMFTGEVAFINGAEEFKNADTELYSVDSERGYLYTSFNMPADMVASFKTSTHRAEYTIVKPLADQDYIVKDNTVKVINRELIDEANTKLAVKYRRRKSPIEVVSKLRPYFTPIVKSYKLRVGKRKNS